MARQKKSKVEVQVVTQNLTVDPNDPRLKPVVDGNDLPVVDINEPVKVKKSKK